MKFVLGEKIGESTKNSFVIEVELMHGDGDGNTQHIVTIPKEKQELLPSVIFVLQEITKICEVSDYQKLQNYLKHNDLCKIWFNFGWNIDSFENGILEVNGITEEVAEEIWNLSFEWKHDITDKIGHGYAQLYGYKVFYYNENGDKFKVDITE